jgi:hypothetical protein
MKKLLVVFSMPFMLVGCIGDEVPTIADYDVTITLRNGIPCFSFDEEGFRNEQISIYSGAVWEYGHVERAWSQTWWAEGKKLKSNECLHYGGDAKLKMNTLYMTDFYIKKRNQQKGRGYGYEAVFCLVHNKDGQTAIQQWRTREAPAACPVP